MIGYIKYSSAKHKWFICRALGILWYSNYIEEDVVFGTGSLLLCAKVRFNFEFSKDFSKFLQKCSFYRSPRSSYARLAWPRSLLAKRPSNHSPNLLYFLLSCVPLVASEQSSSASARRKKQRSIHPNQLPLYGKLLASFQYDQRSSELENDRDHHSLTLKVSRDTAWFFIITAQRAVRSNTMLKHLGGCRAAGGGQPPKSEGGRERA